MIGLLWMAAASAAPLAADPLPVESIACQRTIQFATPYPWTWSADTRAITEATALVVHADATLLRPRQVAQPVLLVEGWPAEVVWQVDDRALVLAPLTVPDTGARVWFGGTVLPETVDAKQRSAALARVTTWPIQAAKQRAEPLAWPAEASRRELVTVLRGWMERCEAEAPPR
ncbi:MAG: hypothetical protein V4850_36900 [Myxococcota bacterium]